MSNQEVSQTQGSEVKQVSTNNASVQRARKKITVRQIRTVLISSTGFFMDAYDIFVINLVVPMLGYVYYQSSSNTVPSNIQGVIKGITNVGNLFGQIIFGTLGDSKGRKSIYGIELLIIIVATIGSAMAGSAATGVGVLGFLGVWRFFLGIGIGGDYPMSATVASEWSSEGRRGQMLALTFSMQGWGQFFGALFDGYF
jgi:PHS family inorganic phosphate transporter-like MFS transporter